MKGLKILLSIIFIGIFAYSGYQLYLTYSEYAKGNTTYKSISDQYIHENKSDEKSDNDEESSAETKKKISSQLPINVDFESLKKDNPDVVGWIYSEGTPINYPILQGETNEEYLHTMIDGRENKAGSIFLDYDCDYNFSDFNSVIYGHHMKDKSMFGSIHGYIKQEYYDEHPVMWILTPEYNYKVVLFAGCLIDTNDIIYCLADSEDAQKELITRMKQDSTFAENKAADDITSQHIVTLSTCAYEYDGARYVLLGWLVPVLE